MKTNNKGFSLVELIVVIAIMAILAAVAIPTFAGFITKANKAADESFANDIEYAVELALSAENVKVTRIDVVMDYETKTAETLTYTTATGKYLVMGDDDTATPANSEIAALISGTLDKAYKLKSITSGTYDSKSGIVHITFESAPANPNPQPQ